jgi:hypothetical protein
MRHTDLKLRIFWEGSPLARTLLNRPEHRHSCLCAQRSCTPAVGEKECACELRGAAGNKPAGRTGRAACVPVESADFFCFLLFRGNFGDSDKADSCLEKSVKP